MFEPPQKDFEEAVNHHRIEFMPVGINNTNVSRANPDAVGWVSPRLVTTRYLVRGLEHRPLVGLAGPPRGGPPMPELRLGHHQLGQCKLTGR
jgi:hypothetical protein